MEERGARKRGRLVKEGSEGGGMAAVIGVGKDEGGGNRDAGGEEAVEDSEGVRSPGGGKRLCGGAEGEDVGGRPPLRKWRCSSSGGEKREGSLANLVGRN